MRYFHYEMSKRMESTRFNEALQKYFPDNDKWGACAYFDSEKNLEFIEINKLSNVTPKGGATWTHYATIGFYTSDDADNGKWEVYSQFNGKKENEMWIFGYYKNFAAAVRRVKNGIENLKPIKIYD